ncbi:MAG TPA: AAA family ATPase [Symbiobacteriaceae bacterium]|nr:AAA family ATPase [Symbiobacteriaceae bacterium]
MYKLHNTEQLHMGRVADDGIRFPAFSRAKKEWSTIDSFVGQLSSYLNARYPMVQVTTQEEERAVQAIRKTAESLLVPRQVFTWSAVRGMVGPAPVPDARLPDRALEFIEGYRSPALFALLDFHTLWRGQGRSNDAQLVRQVRELAEALRNDSIPKSLLFVSPVQLVPAELETEILHLDLPLPDMAELAARFQAVIDSNVESGWLEQPPQPERISRLVWAAAGLTLVQAEQALLRALVEDPSLEAGERLLTDEKRQIIRRTEILEWVDTAFTMADVGGLNNLKGWLERRSRAWDESARRYQLPEPRGVLLTGVPGCGKSLVAKAVSAVWGLPLLRLDMGKIYAGLVGSSEANMRQVIRTAEAAAPVILWIDEIEKGLAGRGGSSDGGISARVFGTLLTWMQEKQKPVFVLATANTLDQLPPELLRKGRFDEIFFVDLPGQRERAAIFAVHLARRLKDPYVASQVVLGESLFAELAVMTDGFSGAEIEQVIVDGLFCAFAAGRPLHREDLVQAIRSTVPLSVTQAEKVQVLRDWARDRAVPAGGN